jgi:outer membrane protein assembly factor BamB
LLRSRVKWKASVKDASPGSILVSNRLIIGSTEGSLSAFNLSSGLRDWSFKAADRFFAPVSYDNGKLYQPSDRGVLHVLSEMSGKELYQVNLKGPVVSAAAISDGAFVGDVLGNVYSIAPDNGAIRWQHTVDGPLWTTPAVTSDLVIVGHSGGDIVALDRTSGREVWKYPVTEVIKASPIVVGEIVVVATMRGSILTLDLHTGTLIARTQLNSAVAFAPISDGSFLYVITQSGRLLCLGERNEQSNQSHH